MSCCGEEARGDVGGLPPVAPKQRSALADVPTTEPTKPAPTESPTLPAASAAPRSGELAAADTEEQQPRATAAAPARSTLAEGEAKAEAAAAAVPAAVVCAVVGHHLRRRKVRKGGLVEPFLYPAPKPSYSLRTFGPSRLLFVKPPKDDRLGMVPFVPVLAATAGWHAPSPARAEAYDALNEDDSAAGYAPGAPPHGRDVVLYFHPNAVDLGHSAETVDALMSLRCDVLAVEYPGYGLLSSFVDPFDKGIAAAADALADFAESCGYARSRTVLYGSSVGTGPACYLAKMRSGWKAVVLQAPFLSIRDAAKTWLGDNMFSNMISRRWDNLEALQHLSSPLLLLHGVEDRIVPVAQGRRLLDEAGRRSTKPAPKHGVFWPQSGHNDVSIDSQILPEITAFLSRCA
eukprot:TRINITY_DN14769_c0_g1_i1.p1 TRINITY_DN14769_c0_g1~~TRINITY_DN14769_c0_g1_i1.p1  ORF type:complete len:423 (+),score=127.03 TRINITY_DN14769_c0_g1_i1:63-1271(+)